MNGLSNLTICYEGLQRAYRNALVRYVRTKMVAVYQSDYGTRLRKPFEKEWDRIRANAYERRDTGEISAGIADEFDLLGVNHFFNLFDAYSDLLCPSIPGSDEQQKKISKQALLQWIKTIKNMRDPLSHPSESDFSFEDS